MPAMCNLSEKYCINKQVLTTHSAQPGVQQPFYVSFMCYVAGFGWCVT
jgi:hypothetical protein